METSSINHPNLTNPEESIVTFWSEIAEQTLTWIKPWQTAFSGGFIHGDVQWFKEGVLNVSENCLDRHLSSKANETALIWEGDEQHESRHFTFHELYQEVCRMSLVLKKLGIKKGDTVGIYLPMIPEAAMAMLACARIGAVHTVVFAGFSAHALRQRLIAADCSCLITADAFRRGGKLVALKHQADEATADLPIKQLVIQHESLEVPFDKETNYWWHELKASVPAECLPEPMNAEDPLFILYTSGSTGQPKGLVHTTGGYLTQAAYTHQLIFNCKNNDIFWCTADVGWITGHSYVVYGPLCNGTTTLMFAGVPSHPDPGRFWRVVEKHKVSVLYTAPTAIRALMRAGDEWLNSGDRRSLKLLGTVGEPINPEVWQWYQQKVGDGRCPVVDTWWQTETGAIMISPKATDPQVKPGSAAFPVPGVVAVLLNHQGIEIEGEGEGLLAIKHPWPSIARTIANDHKRYCQTYLSNGYYITGDGAKRDVDGFYWITGRVDDVLNVSGHRLGTAEIESALITHSAVAEAGVVGIPHDIKGQGIYAYVCLKKNAVADDNLKSALVDCVKEEVSAIAKPDFIHFVHDLPKTRSGKIMRRILRKIACKEVEQIEDLGDLSTLANPQIVKDLMKEGSLA